MLDISAFLLVAIAIERRKAIVKPLSILDPPPLTKTLGAICAIVLPGFVLQTPTIYGSHYAAKNATIRNFCVYIYNKIGMKLPHNSFMLD